MKTLPVGTAYSVWVGVGAVGTVVLGIVLLGESASLARVISVSLIVAGIVGLKLSTPLDWDLTRCAGQRHWLLKAELLARLSKLHLTVFTPVFESFARPLTNRSAYEIHLAIREVVHRTGDLDRSLLLQVFQYWASPPNVFDY
jgi:hypothetical protein